jgi:hypothetical protein
MYPVFGESGENKIAGIHMNKGSGHGVLPYPEIREHIVEQLERRLDFSDIRKIAVEGRPEHVDRSLLSSDRGIVLRTSVAGPDRNRFAPRLAPLLKAEKKSLIDISIGLVEVRRKTMTAGAAVFLTADIGRDHTVLLIQSTTAYATGLPVCEPGVLYMNPNLSQAWVKVLDIVPTIIQTIPLNEK